MSSIQGEVHSWLLVPIIPYSIASVVKSQCILKPLNTWLNPPPLNSRAFLPTFSTDCPDGSHFAQMGSHFVQNTTPTPVLYSAVTYHFREYVQGLHKTPQPLTRTPVFLAWTWKFAKWTTVWASWAPTGQNVWKVDKHFLEVGKLFYWCWTLKHWYPSILVPQCAGWRRVDGGYKLHLYWDYSAHGIQW